MKDVNRNLLLRIGSAAVLAPVVIAAVLCPHPAPIAVVIHLAVVIALSEFYGIVLRNQPRWIRFAGIFTGLLVSVVMFWLPQRPDLLLAILMMATMISTMVHLATLSDIRTATASSGLMLFGIFYVPVLLTSLLLLKQMPNGADWMILVFTITFFGDTGAYAAGRAFGRHKLYAQVSPGKTIQGTAGGLLASIGAAALAKLTYMPQISWIDALAIAIPAAAIGQIGDLVESMVKRGHDIKDSGTIIPGHGGVLDRIDALLFAGAYVYLYARYVFFGGVVPLGN